MSQVKTFPRPWEAKCCLRSEAVANALGHSEHLWSRTLLWTCKQNNSMPGYWSEILVLIPRRKKLKKFETDADTFVECLDNKFDTTFLPGFWRSIQDRKNHLELGKLTRLMWVFRLNILWKVCLHMSHCALGSFFGDSCLGLGGGFFTFEWVFCRPVVAASLFSLSWSSICSEI